jgi:hypothetical protein
MFHLKDTVRQATNPQKVGPVVEIRDMEPRYNVQFGPEPTDTEWVKDHDLELVAEGEEATPVSPY